MPRRSTTGLILLLDALARSGQDLRPVLVRFGLDAERLDPTAFIDRDVELRVNEAIGEALVDPLAGLRAGSSLGIASYGPFTLLLLTCEDTLASVRTAIEFQALTFLFGQLSFRPGRTRSELVLSRPPLADPALRFRADLEVAGTWKLMRDVQRTAGVSLAPERIVMPYRRLAEADVYDRAFGCRVDWGGREARFELQNSALRQRFSTADPGAHAVLRRQAQRLVAELDVRGDDIADRLRAHLAACVEALPSAAESAAALGLSERSLRRQLRSEGRSYRELLDQVRLQKAQALLQDARLPIESIAHRLGYSEAAAFIHAFRRWTGTTPAAFRRRAPASPTGDFKA